jgi:transcriptional regulator with XRE-family HTH domain
MTLLRRVIGTALRRARRDRGQTLRDVANAARVSVQYLSEVERGRKEVSSEVLAAICGAYGWTLLDLVDQVRAELDGELRTGVVVELTSVPSGPSSLRDVASAPRAGGQVRLAA